MYDGAKFMTPSERARLLRKILDEHDQAMFELRESSNAFDAGISSMRQTLAAVQNANQAQGRAIDRVMAANKLALKLFNDPDSP
jgi:flagellar biosynthesis/type III secretory pathway chaperone